jgi:dephospho-CoA kinase
MRKIGITGGIGSGKSTVCKIFELLGIPVYYADDVAKNILDTNFDVSKSVKGIFGAEIFNSDGKADRKKLASIVFNNKEKLAALNHIIHPAVAKDFEEWSKIHNKHPYILKEAAILFESGAYKNVDSVITVTAPVDLRIKRVQDRDKVSREEILNRISKQLTDDDKIKRSDFVIINDEEHLVIPQVLEIHKKLASV